MAPEIVRLGLERQLGGSFGQEGCLFLAGREGIDAAGLRGLGLVRVNGLALAVLLE